MNKEMVVEKINKFKKALKEIVKRIKLGLYVLPEVAITLASVGCTPAVAHATPTDSPVATQSANPTDAPAPTITASPTLKPTSTPETTPEISREEALKKLNITSTQAYNLSDIFIYECTLPSGREVSFLITGYTTDLKDGGYFTEDRNVLDGEVFVSFSYHVEEVERETLMGMENITFVPEFLQGATIKSMYNVCTLPYVYQERGLPIPNSPYMDEIVKYTSPGENPNKLQNIAISGNDLANFILDIIPQENMVWAKDYVEGFVDPIETTQQQSNRNINPVKNGYKTLGYYNSRNTGTKYNVNLINHPFKNHAIRKI